MSNYTAHRNCIVTHQCTIMFILYTNQPNYANNDFYFIIENYNNIYYQDGYYYLKLNDKTKITSLIEYGSIEYNLDKELKNMLLIK